MYLGGRIDERILPTEPSLQWADLLVGLIYVEIVRQENLLFLIGRPNRIHSSW